LCHNKAFGFQEISESFEAVVGIERCLSTLEIVYENVLRNGKWSVNSEGVKDKEGERGGED
jgi:hypothetical protein